ncbi:cell wall metabolism sensor histidine kinase WalK [Halobacillus sp. Marseille-Q1614]|uniref:sensor histidine kinase n=1 Tax=Halobacillus sp. Marseille-Q1614 TaxID=2709134 RepID=UPI00156DF5F0|nr:HAMP domain-containing sensor histidine kinase [Halobacillus sp. Marseille-Q1614]
MLLNKMNKSLASNLRVRLTLINIIILICFILFTGLTIYQTACFLVGDINGVESARQTGFSNELLRYFWVTSGVAIFIGGFMYWKVTRSMLRPIEKLKQSVQDIQNGRYPDQIDVSRKRDEIGQLVHHFNHLNQQLQKNEEVRNRMLSDMSHELRTPLSNLRGYLEALNKGVIDGSPDIYQSLADETDRITDLLSKIDWIKEWDGSAGGSPITPEKVQVVEVIQHVNQLFQLEFERKGVDLTVDAVPAELYVDRRAIQQVLINLLSNALSYYEGEGPVKLKGIREEKDYVLSVKGPGQEIPEDAHEKIFERLYRLDPSRNRQTGGTGLGLAISKEIIERHAGTIYLESDGKMHHFVVKLPI